MSQSLLPFVWFIAILALIPLALWLLKRTPMGGGAAAGHLRVVAALPVAPNQRVMMVEVGQGEDRRWLVLGVTAQSMNTLHVMLPQPESPAGSPFAQTLAQTLVARLRGQQPGSGDEA